MDRETKIQIRETIIILVTTVVVLAVFAFCVSLPFVMEQKEVARTIPENSEYITHGIYKTVDGEYVTLVKTDDGNELAYVTEEEFLTMLKYDVDYQSAKEIAKIIY